MIKAIGTASKFGGIELQRVVNELVCLYPYVNGS